MPRTFTRPLLTPAATRASAARMAEEGPATVPPVISLTTDFGARDPSAAICRGVIASIAPGARILDVSHDVAAFSIVDGALLLWCALPYLPVGVHVAVVDPGVGTARLPVGLRVARGDVLVGPDNGLLLPAAERLGGIVAAHALEAPDFRLPQVSASFHGRDIFAPAGAHLALGVPLEVFGRAVDPSALTRLDLPAPQPGDGVLSTTVIYVDTFGNVKLAGERADLEASLGPLVPGDMLDVGMAPGGRQMPWVSTFGEVFPGDPLMYEDSYGRLCIAVNQGDAGRALSLAAGTRVAIQRA